MSIFSRARKAVSKVASKVKNVASKVKNAYSNVFSAAKTKTLAATGRNQLASAQTGYQAAKKTLAAKAKSPANTNLSRDIQSGGLKILSPGSAGRGGLLNIEGGSRRSTSVSSQSVAPGTPGLTFAETPRTIPGGSPIYRSGTYLSSPILGAGLQQISGGDTRVSSSPSPSSRDMSAPISSGSISSAPSVVLPSAPSYPNPGQINNGGLTGNGYTLDPNTNTLIADEGNDPDADRRLFFQQELQKMIPQKESVYEDREVQRQQREVMEQQREVANYTAQLNSIVAQQNADLLRTRGIASQEGVTETVYGGIEATINREAAIKALPVQAALSAAQGNLQLAQDYLTQLTTWKKEQIDNEYTYKVAVVDSIKDFLKGEEKIRADEIKEQSQRAWEMMKMNIQDQDSWARYAAQEGHPNLIQAITNLDPGSPNFREQLGSLTGQITLKPPSDTDNSTSLGSDLNDAYAAIAAGADPVTVKRAFLADHPSAGGSWDNYFENEEAEIEYPKPEEIKPKNGRFGWGFWGL